MRATSDLGVQTLGQRPMNLVFFSNVRRRHLCAFRRPSVNNMPILVALNQLAAFDCIKHATLICRLGYTIILREKPSAGLVRTSSSGRRLSAGSKSRRLSSHLELARPSRLVQKLWWQVPKWVVETNRIEALNRNIDVEREKTFHDGHQKWGRVVDPTNKKFKTDLIYYYYYYYYYYLFIYL